MRAGAHFKCPVQVIDAIDPQILHAAAAAADVATVVAAYAPVGPGADALTTAAATLAGSAVALVQVQQSWEARFWPHAFKKFFALKQKIPSSLAWEGLC